MNEIESIKDEINLVHKKYLNNALEIISDYTNENKTKADYKGRQIYELLQNADDCFTSNCEEIRVKIELRDNKLIVSNTGKPFDDRGIASLMHSDASSKYENTIGCKGLGFRSVLNWAHSVTICTKLFCVKFSEKAAIENLNFYKRNTNKKHVKELDKIERTAILSSAKVIDDVDIKNEYLEPNYSTSIILECDEKAIIAIQKQLNELQFEELLFLKHIRNIEIISKVCNRSIEAIKEGSVFLIQEENKLTEWKIWEKHGIIEQSNGKSKKYELMLAYNVNPTIRDTIKNDGVLYSFFKTEIRMPFPFLIHGTFELTSQRNGLIKDDQNNKILIDILIDFIIEKGNEIARLNNKCDYEALEFLIPATELYFLDKEYNFSHKLKEKIKSCEIFPTINDQYISFKGKPKYTDHSWHSILNKSTFCNLLKKCSNKKVKKFIDDNWIGFYSEDEFVRLVNKDADEYVSKSLIAELIVLYHDEFGNSKIAPNILIDRDGKRIIDNTFKVFINPSIYFSLPDWCNLRFINQKLENQLRVRWNNCTNRTLISNLSNFGCDEYSFDRVLKELILQSKDNKEKVKSILKWLFNYWEKNNQKFETSLTNVEIRMITRDGSISLANKCYFGYEYGNDVGERIIVNIDNFEFIANLKELGFESESKDLVRSFLRQLGVKKYPIIESMELTGGEIDEYIEYNSKYFPILRTDRDEQYEHRNFFYQCKEIIKVDKIEGIEKILLNSNFEDIVYWLLDDKNLFEHVTSSNEISDFSLMKGYPPRKQDARYVKKEQMRSWLNKIFVNFNWFPTKSKKKVSSYECTVASHKLSPIVEILHINYETLNSLLNRNCKKEVEALFEKLGIAEDIVNLSKEKIYDILIRLPEIDIDFSIGKRIYTQLNLYYKEDDVNKLINNNKKYQEFKKSGMVLAETNKKYGYLPISQVYYVGKKIYSDDVLDSYSKLALNRRAGDAKVEKMFCVKSISKISTVKVDDINIHELNEEYKKDYQKILPYIYAKRYEFGNKNTELNILKKSNICLVTKATIIYNIGTKQRKGELKDYELIYELTGNIAYIKVPLNIKTVDDLKNEMSFISAVAEVITTMINVDGDKDSFVIILSCRSQKDVESYFRSNGDETLSIVNLAKEKFKSSISLKTEFINALSQATQKDDSVIRDLCNRFLSESFNYNALNAIDHFDSLKKLFDALEIDVQDYNRFAYESINLIDYYKTCLKEIKNKYRNRYFAYISKKIHDKSGFIEEFENKKKEYDFLELEYTNSFNFNVMNEFKNKLSLNKLSLNGKDLENQNEDYESICKKLKTSNNMENNNDTRENPIAKEEDIDYKQINEQIKNYTTSKSYKPKIEAFQHKETQDQDMEYIDKKVGVYNAQINKLRERYGFIAESKVYHTLIAKICGKGSVEWMSGNAQKAGEKDEGNDLLGYDIKYSDEKGIHYVEVKGSKSKYIEFTLTKNEFDFATRNKDKFELWFVPIDEQNNPCEPLELGNILLFAEGENLFNNSKFNVEQSEFKLRAKIKQKDGHNV